jgi:hypothetical protein
MSVGKLERVPLREVWKHEAYEFTRWLEGNIDVLAEVLDIGLTNVEREQNAGDFSVDLVAETAAGEAVIIENQLGKSDHNHLGKLLTYLAALEAKVAIWIVNDPRPEHVKAAGWLNESGLARFYLVKLEAVRIGTSPPAPLLTLITGPSEETTEAGEKKKELAGRHETRLRFWTGLLERAKQRTKLHANISPGTASWVGASAGRSGLAFNYVILKNRARVELYIDTGSGETNKSLFQALEVQKHAIEADFGRPLEWEPLEGARACRISAPLDVPGWKDEAQWPATQDTLVETMIRFEKALRPRLEK